MENSAQLTAIVEVANINKSQAFRDLQTGFKSSFGSLVQLMSKAQVGQPVIDLIEEFETEMKVRIGEAQRQAMGKLSTASV